MSDEKKGKIHITGNPEKGSWVKKAFESGRMSGKGEHAIANLVRPKPEDDGKTKRPTGHYYCRLGNGPEWTPCCWYLRDGFWLVPGRQRPFIDSHFE